MKNILPSDHRKEENSIVIPAEMHIFAFEIRRVLMHKNFTTGLSGHRLAFQMPEPYVGKLASTVLRARKLPGWTIMI